MIGPGDAEADIYDLAVQSGRLIAERGGVVVCGGLGGVMEAAALGASQAGGRSLGILPGSDRGAANAHLTLALASGLGELRNGLLVRASDGVVAVGCSWGTLSEVAFAVRAGRPVVSLRGWSLADVAGAPVAGVLAAQTAAEAVASLYAMLDAG